MVEAQIRELVAAVQSVQAQLMASEEARTTLQNGRSALTHGTSGGLPSSMAQTALGGSGQLSFAVTRPGASGTEGRDAARGAAANGRNQCGSSRR